MNPPGRDFAARLAVAENRLDGQGSEIQRMRERLHLIEGDRQALRLAVRELASVRADLPAIAHVAAEHAIELEREHRQDRSRAGLSMRTQVLMTAIGLTSFLILLYDRLG